MKSFDRLLPANLIVGVLHVVCADGVFAGAPEPEAPNGVVYRSLTPDERRIVDDAAEQVRPASRVARDARFFGGAPTAAILDRVPVSTEDEARLAAAAHAEIISTRRVLPTPLSAGRVLDRLAAELPPRMNPWRDGFTLTVLESDAFDVFTVGGGRIYITRAALESLQKDDADGDAQLAFALGRQMGHVCREHCRRGYRLLRIQDAAVSLAANETEREKLRNLVRASVAVAGPVVRFLHSENEERRADTFALSLCRNAGYDREAGCDVLRCRLLPVDDDRTSPAAAGDARTLRRLTRLRRQIEGVPDGKGFGIHAYDVQSETFQLLEPSRQVRNARRVIVLVHGMESNLDVMTPLAAAITADVQFDPATLIVGFQYPSDAGLARSGRFLTKEIGRFWNANDHLDFVCHSAGGLVFRWYAEVERGAFHQAVFLGTPHDGSDLARLRSLLEVKQYLGDVRLGYSRALENVISDGLEEIGQDLQRDSLFLRYLNRQERPADRYAIVRGRAIGRTRGALLKASVVAGRVTLERLIEREVAPTRLQVDALAKLKRLRIPREITGGDLAVTLESAHLPGVERVETVETNHMRLPRDAKVIRLVLSELSRAE